MPRKPSPWSARFAEPVDERVKRFTASVSFDRRLAKYDIEASLAHARMLAAQGILARRDLAAIQRGLTGFRARNRVRPLPLVARGRGRAPEHRAPSHLLGGRRGQAPAYRALAQRPGGDRRAAVAARRDRRAARADRRPRARAARPGRASRRARDAGIYPPAGRAAGDLRPSPARLRGDVGARSRTTHSNQKACQPAPARCGGARRHRLSDRPQARGARARLRGAVRELARRGLGSRLRDRVLRLRRARHDPPVAARRGAGALGEPALRLRAPARRLLHRLLDHAAEEEPRRAGAGARQERPRGRRAGRAAHADEGAAARLQQGQPGRQGAALRRRRHAQGFGDDIYRSDCGNRARAPSHARSSSRGPRDGDRPRRLPGAQGRALSRCARGRCARGARGREARASTWPLCLCRS